MFPGSLPPLPPPQLPEVQMARSLRRVVAALAVAPTALLAQQQVAAAPRDTAAREAAARDTAAAAPRDSAPAAAPAPAIPVPQIMESLQIHGHLTQAYAQSDEIQINGIPTDATGDYRTAALQFRYGFTDNDNV